MTESETDPSVSERLVSAYFRAVEAGDAEALLRTVASDVRLEVPASLPYGKNYVGHDGVRAALAAFGQAWSRNETRDLRLIADKDGAIVVAVSEMAAVSRVTGRRVTQSVAEVFSVRGGAIVRVQPFYQDTAALIHALTP